MSKAVIKLCVYAGTLERCRFFFFSFFFFRFFFCACAGQGEKKIKNFEQVPGRADRNCGEWIALFFFLGGHLEHVQGGAQRNCGGSTAPLCLFSVSSLSLLCLFSVSSLSLLCLFSVSSLSLLCLFSVSSLSLLCLFSVSSLSLLCLFSVSSLSLCLCLVVVVAGAFDPFFFGSELRAGVRPSLQKLRRVDRTFLFFFSGLNFEHVLGRAYRDCGERER